MMISWHDWCDNGNNIGTLLLQQIDQVSVFLFLWQSLVQVAANWRFVRHSGPLSKAQRRSGFRPLCRATVLAHGGPSSDIAMPRRGPSRQPLVSSAEELILDLCQQLVIDPPVSTTGGPTMLKLSIQGRFRFAQEYVNQMAILRFVGGFLISLFTAQSSH
jgi:hypothetical protein